MEVAQGRDQEGSQTRSSRETKTQINENAYTHHGNTSTALVTCSNACSQRGDPGVDRRGPWQERFGDQLEKSVARDLRGVGN